MYASVADLRNTILDMTVTVMSDAQVTYWIGRADSVINSRLSGMYYVPFTTTPDVVNTISIFLTAYYCTRVIFAQTTTEKNTWVEGFREQAMELLDSITSGGLIIVDTDGSILSKIGSPGIKSSTEKYKPVFNEGEETQWGTSAQKIVDEENKYR